jgi:hypothetical protein
MIVALERDIVFRRDFCAFHTSHRLTVTTLTT